MTTDYLFIYTTLTTTNFYFFKQDDFYNLESEVYKHHHRCCQQQCAHHTWYSGVAALGISIGFFDPTVSAHGSEHLIKTEFIVVPLAATTTSLLSRSSYLPEIDTTRHSIQAIQSLQFQREDRDASGSSTKEAKNSTPILSIYIYDFNRAVTKLSMSTRKKNRNNCGLDNQRPYLLQKRTHTPDLGLSEDVENHGTLRKVKSKIVAHFESKTA